MYTQPFKSSQEKSHWIYTRQLTTASDNIVYGVDGLETH